MKKLLFILGILASLFFSTIIKAEEADNFNTEATSEQIEAVENTKEIVTEAEKASFHQIIKEKFIEGGWEYMTPILICLILGLAISIERILYLNLATSNSEKLLNDIENNLEVGNVDAAREICASTKGPVANLFGQGLERINEGVAIVEKSIVSSGSVQMGRLERGMSWISLFIAIAPMLGFMGTVIGMIQSFDAIAEFGDAPTSVIAAGIKVALITTVAGLIVAIILQVFYNYLVAKIDSLVNDMEESSISFIDILVKKGFK